MLPRARFLAVRALNRLSSLETSGVWPKPAKQMLMMTVVVNSLFMYPGFYLKIQKSSPQDTSSPFRQPQLVSHFFYLRKSARSVRYTIRVIEDQQCAATHKVSR